jgi:endogenous inhibitor of DNA gyrase (YacG/DUF329 family)
MSPAPESTIQCRHCGKLIRYRSVRDVPTFPFCSERCKLLDLGLWLEEEHKISRPLETKNRDDADFDLD